MNGSRARRGNARPAGWFGTGDAPAGPSLVIALGLALSIVGGAAASAGQPVSEAQRFRPSDVLDTTDVGEVQFSPDGRTVLVTTSRALLDGNRTTTQVLLLPATGGQPVPILVDGPAGASTFRWSGDSRRIAFVGTRDGKSAIWVLDVASRALTRVCDFDRSNAYLSQAGESLAWSPDGRSLAFVATVDAVPAMDPVIVTRMQYKARTTFADNRRMHVFVVDSNGGAPAQLTTGTFDEHSIAWTPDGRTIVFASNREPEPDAFHNYDLFAVDLATKEVRQLTRTRGVEASPLVSPDGRWIAYKATTRPMATIDSVAEDAHLWVMPSGGGEARKVNGSLDRRTAAFAWSADSASLIFSASDRGKTLLYKVDLRGGASTPLFDRAAQVAAFSLATNGAIAFSLSTPTAPRELYHLQPGETEPKQLTTFNADQLRRWRLSAPQTVTFTSRDGVQVEGWYYPPVQASGRVPLLLNIHGGPHGMFGYVFDPMVQGYAGHGYAVLNVNPRGSIGYGQAFSDGSIDQWGGRDYQDLMEAVDHILATRPEIDPNRLGVTGRSYGGFMTNWVITQTGRFKAAVSVASVANLISFYGTSIYQDLIHAEFGGFPWSGDNFAKLWKWSPLAHVGNATTPTLFVHGEVDNDVHVTEAEAMYMALRRRGVETVLARYPREGHAFREPKHRLDQLTRTLEWFDRFLMPGSPGQP
jgi:dipeptidyl aminopeptidase/acylaminoacyl peptidase